jgi:hypothetical protein
MTMKRSITTNSFDQDYSGKLDDDELGTIESDESINEIRRKSSPLSKHKNMTKVILRIRILQRKSLKMLSTRI